MYSYRWLRDAGCYTVFDEDGEPESDHDTADQAAHRVRFLNGGRDGDEARLAALEARLAGE